MIDASGRRETSERRYQLAREMGYTKPLQEETTLANWQYWKLVKNRFPYDILYDVHDLLIPKREFPNRKDMTIHELVELQEIIDELETHYDLYFENYTRKRSILNLYHIHFARFTDRENFKL